MRAAHPHRTARSLTQTRTKPNPDPCRSHSSPAPSTWYYNLCIHRPFYPLLAQSLPSAPCRCTRDVPRAREIDWRLAWAAGLCPARPLARPTPEPAPRPRSKPNTEPPRAKSAFIMPRCASSLRIIVILNCTSPKRPALPENVCAQGRDRMWRPFSARRWGTRARARRERPGPGGGPSLVVGGRERQCLPARRQALHARL